MDHDKRLGMALAKRKDVLDLAMNYRRVPTSRLTRAQLYVAMQALSWATRQFLGRQIAVRFDGIGTFKPTIRVFRSGDRTKLTEVRRKNVPASVSRIVVSFRISAPVRDELTRAYPSDAHLQTGPLAHGDDDGDGEEGG